MDCFRRAPENLWRRLWTGTAAAVLMVGFGASDCEASCGDYVMSGRHAAGPARGNPADARLPSDAESRGPVAPAPCRGPGCGQAPAPAAPSAPSPTESRSSELSGLLHAVSPAACRDAKRETFADARQPSAGYPQRLERPPQAA